MPVNVIRIRNNRQTSDEVITHKIWVCAPIAAKSMNPKEPRKTFFALGSSSNYVRTSTTSLRCNLFTCSGLMNVTKQVFFFFFPVHESSWRTLNDFESMIFVEWMGHGREVEDSLSDTAWGSVWDRCIHHFPTHKSVWKAKVGVEDVSVTLHSRSRKSSPRIRWCEKRWKHSHNACVRQHILLTWNQINVYFPTSRRDTGQLATKRNKFWNI